MNKRTNFLYEFGPFRLDPAEQLLLQHGQSIRITPKALQVLLVLVQNRGRVVEKQDLIKEVWPDAFVEEANLTQNIHTLRKIFGEASGPSSYIETVPRRGYRFVAEVRELKGALPWFQRLTFRRGSIQAARFAPDGQAIIYGAAWEGKPVELFITRPGNPEGRSLGFTGAGLLGVSRAGEMALALNRKFLQGYVSTGTLARVSVDGGHPRAVMDNVQWADSTPDGAALCIVHLVNGRTRLEFPIGTVLYETGGWISYPRISPTGETVAFLDHPIQNDDSGAVAIIGADKKKRTLSEGWVSVQGLAWSATGGEVWFTAARAGNARALRAVKLSGQERVIERVAGGLTLHDISRDGRVLLTRDNTRLGISGLAPGATAERDLSWLDWSLARDLSRDGSTLLFTEAGEAGGINYGVYIRRMDGSPAVRLGDGSALAFSPDFKWVLTKTATTPARLLLLPTGTGAPHALERAELNYHQWAAWLPDSRRFIFTGNQSGTGSRLYLQDVRGGSARCITPEAEGVQLSSPHAISPGGTWLAAIGPDQRTRLYSLSGEASRPAKGVETDEMLIRWGADEHMVYTFKRGEIPARIYRINLADGRRELWRETVMPDPAGIHEILRMLLTPDGASYAYTYTRDIADLYQIEGLG